jgi:penicillin-binding protein 1C
MAARRRPQGAGAFSLRSVVSGVCIAGSAALLLVFALMLPAPLFTVYYSPVLYDRNGTFLGAMVSYDGQWRFPPKKLPDKPDKLAPVNEKFAVALIEAEDRRFPEHRGIDFPAIGRAFIQNAGERRIVSGASTITMQTIRLMRPGKKRNLLEKGLEALLALRLELSYSKDEILALYAANAPFGANVVGLEAAGWRWFGRASEDLSWGEAAMLAALPNGPGLIHPGRNRESLMLKRDALLERLCARGLFDRETLALAKDEALPGEPLPLPGLAPHLLVRRVLEAGGIESFSSDAAVISTLDYAVQERAAIILNRWSERFAERGIMNGACLILDTASGETLAYVGNTDSPEAPAVDIAASPRSSGSLLKPFLYAAMLDSGYILPSSLISDIPTRVGSYSPENNSRGYLGVVPADSALARSLNVPAVRNLRQYGIEPFAELLKALGVTTLFRSPADYGLPLILGGAEVSLWDMAHVYAGLANRAGGEAAGPLSGGAAWLTLEALTFAVRPGEEAQWQDYAGSRRIAWKTGTSFGNRDAWAVGVTPAWTVAVWIGNASGEGRAELVSASTSAPVLFELFSALDSMNSLSGRKNGSWFPQPAGALNPVEVCAYSGFPAGPDCAGIKIAHAPKDAPFVRPCPYCRTVTLNESEDMRVLVKAGSGERVHELKWFVLPPAEEWYYRKWNLDYRPLPPPAGGGGGSMNLALFNPEENASIYVPREIDGREGRVVFQAAHRDQAGIIYWHLDETYMGATEVFHEMAAHPGPGFHTLILVDGGGARLTRRFEVLSGAD